MDRTTALLSDFATGMAGYQQPRSHEDATKARLADTIGCGVAGSTSELAGLVRRLPGGASPGASATLLGCTDRTNAEHAAFANGTMVRYQDLNDMLLVRGGGHPSDVIPAILAAAECADRPAKVLVGIAMAYEVFAALSTAVDLRPQGWDPAALIGLAICVGASHVLGLTREQAAQALSIMASMAGPTLQARRGELSHWKACASPMAARLALFATFCGRGDIRGPSDAIEGRYGLWRQVTGRFEPDLSSFESDPWITKSAFKAYPAVYHAQTAIEAAAELKRKHDLSPEGIDRISVLTYQRAYDSGAADPTRWQPTTRETADHSLPFLIACTLRDGSVSEASYAPPSLDDPGVAVLMRKIEISVSAEFTAMLPHRTPAEISVDRTAGGRVREHVEMALGHPDRPGSERFVQDKFRAQTAGLVDAARLWSACQELDGSSRVGRVMAQLGQPFGAASPPVPSM